ncbi:MAG: hypothetical protein KDD62_10085 [Bdellovibrionales bacterium]|nr:hypothetical protein [Bdellovibrionales bacterium]
MLRNRVVPLIAFLLVVSGCDKFYGGSITVPEPALVNVPVAQIQAPREEAIRTLEEFAQLNDFSCSTKVDKRLQQIGWASIAYCRSSRAGGTLSLSENHEEKKFIYGYIEATTFWPSRPPTSHFCQLQSKMIKFFADKFGIDKIDISSVGTCEGKDA